MGLLNNRDFDLSAFDGPFGPVLFRSPLQGDGSAGFGVLPATDPAQANGAFDGAAVPFGFAGPGSLNFNPPVDPAIQSLQTRPLPTQQQSVLVPVQDDSGAAQDASPLDEAALAQQARDAAAQRLARQFKGAGGVDLPPAQIAPITLGTINSVGRSFANGVPIIGAFNNRINAAINASIAPALNPLFAPEDQLSEPTFAERFQHSLRDQNVADAQFSKERPILDGLASFAGGAASVGGAAKSIPGVAAAFGDVEAPLFERIFRGTSTGAAIGAADAAARDKDILNGADRGACAVRSISPGHSCHPIPNSDIVRILL
jgi:hypothetical protein